MRGLRSFIFGSCCVLSGALVCVCVLMHVVLVGLNVACMGLASC